MSAHDDTRAPLVRHDAVTRLERHLARRSAAARKLERYENDRRTFLAERHQGMSR